MSETQTIAAEARQETGTGNARATRRAGKVPGIIYGDGNAPLALSFDPLAISKAYRRAGFMSSVIDVEIDGKATKALPREVQTHPIKDHIMHVDFMRVGPKTKVTVNVPVHFINDVDSPGLARGGVLNVVRHDVELRCPAMSIPEYLEGSLADLDIGDSIKISAITLPGGVAPTITDRDFTIATIAAPTIEVEPSAEAVEGEEGEEGEIVEGAEGEAPEEKSSEEAASE